MNFKELTDLVWDNHYKNSKSADKTLPTLNELTALIGAGKDITKINVLIADSLVNTWNTKKNSIGTINRKLSILKKILTYAYERDLITKKPIIKIFKDDAKKILYFKEEEEQQLLEYFKLKHSVMYSFCVIGFKTGMRMGEILTLTRENIEDGYIRIYAQKGVVARSIPMTPLVKEVIERLPEELFIDELNNQNANYHFKTTVKNLGMNPNYSIHTMRHTFCSRLVQKGVDLYTIQTLAGHTDYRTTQRYAHLKNSNLEDAINLL